MPQTGSTTDLAGRVRDRAETGMAAVAPGGTLRDQIKLMEDQWANALPRTVSPERFVRTVLTEVSNNPALADCNTATFLGACTVAAQLGLEFGPLGLAYLVPFYNSKQKRKDCQLIVGYKGYIQLARRSGEVKDIKAVAVYERDEFDFWEDEDGTHLLHRPKFEDRGEIVRYFGRCTFTNGGSLVMLVSLDDINARKARSQSADMKFSPWQSDEEAMKLKTVVRIMIPWMPLATEVAQGLAKDEQVVRLAGSHLVVEQPPAIEAVIDVQAQEAQNGSEGPSDAPQGDGDPGPVEPPSQPTIGPEVDDANLKRAMAVVEAWDEDKVNEVSLTFGLEVRGQLKAKRVRLLPIIVAGIAEGDPAVTDLI